MIREEERGVVSWFHITDEEEIIKVMKMRCEELILLAHTHKGYSHTYTRT